MKIIYQVRIDNPSAHVASVALTFESTTGTAKIFMPSWSPGSYLIREYARHVRSVRAVDESGRPLVCAQVAKNIWEIQGTGRITAEYEIYLHEIGVRNAFIDFSHAFLHWPSLLMGVLGEKMGQPVLEIIFPDEWTEITSSLVLSEQTRGRAVFTASDFDDLLDSPVEIGNQEVSSFEAFGKRHEIAFWGAWNHCPWDIKKDIATIVKFIGDAMGGVPYERYSFIVHLAPGFYGGLEHADSCVLHADGFKMGGRKAYVQWLGLVAHEYFHLWNVKRIRPKELGPFDYINENYTTLLWLSEGLTSFVDNLFILRAGLCTMEEYLELLKDEIKKYEATPGRHLHSLEQSSFNAWVKLYRPDEDSVNSSVSYYLKGALVFLLLHGRLKDKGSDSIDFVKGLWNLHQRRPEVGVTSEEVFNLVPGELRAEFIKAVTENSAAFELPLEESLASHGFKIEREEAKKTWIGITPDYKGDRVFVKSVLVNGPAMRSNINAGDEILAVNNMRVTKKEWSEIETDLVSGMTYPVLLARQGIIREIPLATDVMPPIVKKISVADSAKASTWAGVAPN
jgi:predicted metalloprotease with PDZ domain